MDSTSHFSRGKRVRCEPFGIGTVALDEGATVIVRFDHGIEACERHSLIPIRSVADCLDQGEWDRGSRGRR